MRSPTLLLLEDDEEVCGLLVRAYRKIGFRVVMADNEEEAIRAALRTPPDLIMVELGRPSAAMARAGRHVRRGANLSARDVPVVVYADRAEDSFDEGDELDLGSNTYVIMPEDAGQEFLLRLTRGASEVVSLR